MGKNAGKKLVRPSRKKAFELSLESTAALTSTPKAVQRIHCSEPTNEMIPVIERQISDGLSVLPVPDELVPGSRSLLQTVISFIGGPRYAPEMSNVLDSTGISSSIWVQFLFLDQAYFHCMVALSLTVLNKLVVEPTGSLVTTRHLSKAFRLINERLSGNDAVSDTTIASVLMMAQYERQIDQYSRSLVHMKGLRRMIELRGGIRQLTRINPRLTQKIFRLDLEYAIYTGSATRFSVQEIANFARLINDANSGRLPKLNHCAFHDSILLLGYRLIEMRPLGSHCSSNLLEDMVHLGLATFVATFFWSLDRRAPIIPLLSRSICSVVDRHSQVCKEEEEVLLWLLFIGATCMSNSTNDDIWLVPKTAQTMRSLALHTWESVDQVLAAFPWVTVTHDSAARALWQRSCAHLRLLTENFE
ncbi:hypothetical protein BC1G_08780 [Paecilomyces variotii No. 5]|uniref:Fungal-specific transcription factor domain-containing protein n=1 Tax=Byssochlamys spectabilis (strain No. 5 / NBRC 109023) TaxID=1356009 RepID=V5FTB2_BYSSN|nr:hypothetical protein BC1G_08780 [Paecilomyces variotii No. 5]